MKLDKKKTDDELVLERLKQEHCLAKSKLSGKKYYVISKHYIPGQQLKWGVIPATDKDLLHWYKARYRMWQDPRNVLVIPDKFLIKVT